MDKTLLATACRLSVLSASAQVPADLILIHGKILTVDPKDSIAQAVAIRQGKINRRRFRPANPAARRAQNQRD
jgi:hypothetical protein